jgi:hypothetical protein
VKAKEPKRSKEGKPTKYELKQQAFALHDRAPDFAGRMFSDDFGVTQDSLTRLTGFSPRAVAHWASGRVPSGSAQKRLTEVMRLFDALSELVEPKAIGAWLKRPNPALDGSTPLQVIERGEGDRIWRLIWELQAGNTG